MNIPLVAFGGVSGAVSLILLWKALGAQKEFAYMQRMNATANAVSHGVMAELVGKAVPAGASLKAPKSGKECVYYRFKVERREAHHSKNGTSYTWTTVSESVEGVPFFIDDGTGKVLLDLSGVKDVDAMKSFESVENNPAVQGRVLGFNLSLGNQPMRYTEYCIPAGQQIYAMGLIRHNEDNSMQLVRPSDERPFLVSCRSEESLKAERKSHEFWFKAGAGILGVVALAFLYYGITGA